MATHRQKIVSSGRLPNGQHSEFTLLERQQRSLGKVQRYLDAPVEEDILVNDNTKAHRQWLMRTWNKYFHDQSIDPDTIWTGLCEGGETATAWTKAFFSDYVEHSVRPVMVLGPGEYEDKRMVKCITVQTLKPAQRNAEPLTQLLQSFGAESQMAAVLQGHASRRMRCKQVFKGSPAFVGCLAFSHVAVQAYSLQKAIRVRVHVEKQTRA